MVESERFYHVNDSDNDFATTRTGNDKNDENYHEKRL